VDRSQLVHKRSNDPPAHHAVIDQWEAPAHLAGASHFPLEGSHRWLHANHDHNVGIHIDSTSEDVSRLVEVIRQ
jgi:hypothetical protein